jgi:hypothetical protein
MMAEAAMQQDGAQVAANDWHAGFDEDTRGWLSGMGVDKLPERDALAKVIPMYRNAEKKLGVPADQLLQLPKEGDDAAFKAVMARLGAPESPDGYGLTVPEGQNDGFLKTATGWFHELGIPKRQAEGLAAKWNDYAGAQRMAEEERFNAQADRDIAALRGEYGEDYDKNVELARRVRRAAGLSDDEAIAFERAVGVGRAMKVFAELGKAMGEHRFVGGEGQGASFGMSVEGARARIVDLKKDAAWMAAYFGGDADKKAEWTRLHKVAFPEAE